LGDYLLDFFARVGRRLRFVFAIFLSSFLLIDLAMLRDAPRSELFDLFPRFAANAAPAAICCFFDLAGIKVITRLVSSLVVAD
jgi:hypothetical protein